MKKLIAFFSFLILLCIQSSQGKGVSEQTTFYPKEVLKLLDQRQYLSAWKALDKFYANDSSVKSVSTKSDFCLKYFSHTLKHQKFFFVDADSGKSLLEIRQTPLSTSQVPVLFNPEKELSSYDRSSNAPTIANIHLSLGQYYYDVWVTYKKKWIKSEDETIALFYYHYDEAYKQGLYTDQSLYALSLYYQRRRSFKKAKDLLLACLKENKNHAPAHYNLAYSYNLEDSTEKALFHAEKAFDNYEVNQYRGDAAVMCGVLNCDLKNYEEGTRWLLVADALTPGNLVAYEYLLISYLATNKKDEAALITKNLYHYDWKSGRIFNSILEAYRRFNKESELILYLESELELHPHDKEYVGFNHLHLTQIYIVTGKREEAVYHCEESKKSFKISYDKDHSIFRLLEKITAQARNL